VAVVSGQFGSAYFWKYTPYSQKYYFAVVIRTNKRRNGQGFDNTPARDEPSMAAEAPAEQEAGGDGPQVSQWTAAKKALLAKLNADRAEAGCVVLHCSVLSSVRLT